MNFFTRLFRDRTGASAIEYGLIAALIAIAAITATKSLGEMEADAPAAGTAPAQVG